MGSGVKCTIELLSAKRNKKGLSHLCQNATYSIQFTTQNQHWSPLFNKITQDRVNMLENESFNYKSLP